MSFRNVFYDCLTGLGIFLGKLPLCGPRVVQLNISDECNLDCIMCNRSLMNAGGFMDRKTVLTIIRELYGLGLREIYFHGYGEPFLHPHIFDIFTNTHTEFPGLRQYVVTNGTRLTEKAVNCLVASDVGIRISLHAGDVETWRRINPRVDAGLFRRIESGIATLCQRRSKRVEVLFVIHKSNVTSIEAMFDFCGRTGVRHMLFRPMRLYRGPDGEYMNDQLLLTEDEHTTTVEAIRRLGDQHKETMTVDSTPFDESNYAIRQKRSSSREFYDRNRCLLGWVFSLVLRDGTVLGCLEESFDTPMGNIHDQSFRSIWWGHAYHRFRKQGFGDNKNIVDEHCRTWCQHLRTNRRWNKVKRLQFGSLMKEIRTRSIR